MSSGETRRQYTSYVHLTIPAVGKATTTVSSDRPIAGGAQEDGGIDQEITPTVTSEWHGASSKNDSRSNSRVSTSSASSSPVAPSDATTVPPEGPSCQPNDDSVLSEPELFHDDFRKQQSHLFEALPSDNGYWEDQGAPKSSRNLEQIPYADEDSECYSSDDVGYYGPRRPVDHCFVPVRYIDQGYCVYDPPPPPPSRNVQDLSYQRQFRPQDMYANVPHDRSPSPSVRDTGSRNRYRIRNQSLVRESPVKYMPRSISSPGAFRDHLREQLVRSPVSSLEHRQRSVKSPEDNRQRCVISPVAFMENRQRLVQSPHDNLQGYVASPVSSRSRGQAVASPTYNHNQMSTMSPQLYSNRPGTVPQRQNLDNRYVVMSPVPGSPHRSVSSPASVNTHRSLRSPITELNGDTRKTGSYRRSPLSPSCVYKEEEEDRMPHRPDLVNLCDGRTTVQLRDQQPEILKLGNRVIAPPPPTPSYPSGRAPAPPPRDLNSVNKCQQIHQFIASQFAQQNGAGEDLEEVHDRCQRLEVDKENLTLQVSVLNDQIDALNDKIKDLEITTREKQEHVNNAEEMLQHELLNKSSLEAAKLEMMSNVSQLKLKLVQMEKRNLMLEDKIKHFEIDNANLKLNMLEKDSEIASLQSKLTRTSGKNSVDSNYNLWKMLQEQSAENDNLQKKINGLLASNDEKDQNLEDMKKAFVKHQKFNEMGTTTHSGKSDRFFHPDDELSDSALATTPSSSRKSDTGTSSPVKSDLRMSDKPPPVPRHATPPHLSTPTATSTPIHSATSDQDESSLDNYKNPKRQPSSSFSNLQRANSAEELIPPNKTPPARARHGVKHYGTVPRQHAANLLEQLEQELQQNPNNNSHSSKPTSDQKPTKSSGVSFGKGFFRLRTSKRSCSAPNLAADDHIPQLPENKSSSTLKPGDLSPTPNSKEKPKGFRKIFGKLRRSSSGGFDQSNEFKRGGMRATAGPRLGWSKDLQKPSLEKVDIPFSEWDKDQIALWLHSLGLTAYMGECKRWVKHGAHLMKARPHQLEKELGIKNPLHRKKLHLALQAVRTKSSCEDSAVIRMGELDYHWVTRWLDDIGIPQYKDVFSEARIDGRVLHNLTVEDLFSMKITNLLHHICIKRGIQVLRLNNYNSNCLRRRPVPGESNHFKHKEVALWTNHRVMEWLRSVDLSEYAPNLRGSGVHGALMVYEPKFNADLLAMLLSIPPSKTLLRRHLNTHFKELLGISTIQAKRDAEATPNFIPLTPSAKVKAVRRGQFSLRKKNKNELEFEDYVCPMSIQCLSEMQGNNDEENGTAVKEIEAVSDEIDTLTTMLKDEAFLANMTTTNV